MINKPTSFIQSIIAFGFHLKHRVEIQWIDIYTTINYFLYENVIHDNQHLFYYINRKCTLDSLTEVVFCIKNEKKLKSICSTINLKNDNSAIIVNHSSKIKDISFLFMNIDDKFNTVQINLNNQSKNIDNNLKSKKYISGLEQHFTNDDHLLIKKFILPSVIKEIQNGQTHQLINHVFITSNKLMSNFISNETLTIVVLCHFK
jgi:hypothetical protein